MQYWKVSDLKYSSIQKYRENVSDKYVLPQFYTPYVKKTQSCESPFLFLIIHINLPLYIKTINL